MGEKFFDENDAVDFILYEELDEAMDCIPCEEFDCEDFDEDMDFIPYEELAEDVKESLSAQAASKNNSDNKRPDRNIFDQDDTLDYIIYQEDDRPDEMQADGSEEDVHLPLWLPVVFLSIFLSVVYYLVLKT